MSRERFIPSEGDAIQHVTAVSGQRRGRRCMRFRPAESGDLDGVRETGTSVGNSVHGSERRRSMRRLSWFVRSKKRAAATAVTLLLLVGGGVAVAQWLTTVAQPQTNVEFGSLNGTVVKMNPTVYPTGKCFPNGACDGLIRLNNTSGGALSIKSWTGSATSGDAWDVGLSTVDAGHPSCTINGLQNQTNGLKIVAATGKNIPVPVGQSDITLPGVFTAGDIDNACQGAQVKLVPNAPGFVLTVSQ